MAVDPSHQAPWERAASADESADQSVGDDGGSASALAGGGYVDAENSFGGGGGDAQRSQSQYSASVAEPPPADGAQGRPFSLHSHYGRCSALVVLHANLILTVKFWLPILADLDKFPGLAALEAQFRATLGALQSGAKELSNMNLNPTQPPAKKAPPPKQAAAPAPQAPGRQPSYTQQQPQPAASQRSSGATGDWGAGGGGGAANAATADTADSAAAGAPDPKAVSWAKANPWFGNDSEMTEFAYKVHDELVGQQGMDPASDAYYAALDSCVQARFPGRQGAGPAPLPPRWTSSKQAALGANGLPAPLLNIVACFPLPFSLPRCSIVHGPPNSRAFLSHARCTFLRNQARVTPWATSDRTRPPRAAARRSSARERARGKGCRGPGAPRGARRRGRTDSGLRGPGSGGTRASRPQKRSWCVMPGRARALKASRRPACVCSCSLVGHTLKSESNCNQLNCLCIAPPLSCLFRGAPCRRGRRGKRPSTSGGRPSSGSCRRPRRTWRRSTDG